MIARLRQSFFTALPGLALLALWQAWVGDNAERLFLFSKPSIILNTLAADIMTGEMWQNAAYTGGAAAGGLVLGAAAGMLLGIAMWMSPVFSTVSRPYLTLLGAIPVFSLAPMLILWFGIGLVSKIMMAAFAVFLLTAAQTHKAMQDIAAHHLLFADSLGASAAAKLRHAVLPGAAHWILSGLRTNVGFAVLGAFIAEFISSQHGLGHAILKAGSLYDMPHVFSGIVIIALLSFLLERGILATARATGHAA